MLIIGGIVRWGTELMNQYLGDIYSEFQEVLRKHGDVDISNFDIGDLLSNVTLSFIVIGSFFFVIGILGCVGACCTVRPMLILVCVKLTLFYMFGINHVVITRIKVLIRIINKYNQ